MEQESKFNPDKLSEDQLELLVLLAEECGEVIHAAMKCIRNKDYKPTQADEDAPDNLQWLKSELIGLEIIIYFIYNFVTPSKLTFSVTSSATEINIRNSIREKKLEKLVKWTNVFNHMNKTKP